MRQIQSPPAREMAEFDEAEMWPLTSREITRIRASAAAYSSSTLATCACVEQSSEMQSSQFSYIWRRTDSMASRRNSSDGSYTGRMIETSGLSSTSSSCASNARRPASSKVSYISTQCP
jgi:hypothetical protein